MSVVTLSFDLRQRRVVSADDASPPNWIPQNWISHRYAFTFEAADGLQEDPGVAVVRSATRRHLFVLVPPGQPDTAVPSGWPAITILDRICTIGGVEVLTNPQALGVLDLWGDALPQAHVYWAEAEELATAGKWRGSPWGGPVVG